MEKLAGERAKKIIDWFDKYGGVWLWLIIVGVAVFRLYWFFKVGEQPWWWDEGDYMGMAKRWAGISDVWGISPIRPVLLPFIISLLMRIGLGEMSVRFLILLMSIVAIPLIYGIGKRLFNKKVGLISAFFLGIFWSFTFYSYRILVDVPVAVLWLATIYTFFEAYKGNKGMKYFVMAGIFLGLSFLMKFSSMLLVLIFAFYVISTEKHRIFLNRRMIVFFGVSFVTIIPFLIFEYITFGHPLQFMINVSGSREVIRTLSESLINQVIFSLNLLHNTIIVLLVFGFIIILLEIFIIVDRLFDKFSLINSKYFLFLWACLSLLFFGYFGYGEYMDERYYFVFYPALLIFAAAGLERIYVFLERYNKLISLILVCAIIGFAGYQHINHTNQIIEVKSHSYIQIKDASIYVRDNTLPNEHILLSEEAAEIAAYTERNWSQVLNKSDLLEKIAEKNPKYLILTFYFYLNPNDASFQERLEVVQFVFSNPNIFIPEQMYGPAIDKEGKIPIGSVFRINKSGLL